MKIGWIGFHQEGLLALKAILEAGYPVTAVITLKPDLAKRRSGAVDYHPLCMAYGVPVYEVEDINDPASINLLDRLSLDLAFVIGWSQIVREAALSKVKIGMIGAHASLLPHNRGSAPINWALIHGEEETGNSLIWFSAEVDAGDLIDQVPIPITMYDTCASLYQRVAEANRDMILRVLPKLLHGDRPGRPQARTAEPILARRRPKDGAIDWHLDAVSVYNFIRALARPYPGAYSFMDNGKWIVWHSALLPVIGCGARAPGEIIGSVVSPQEDVCGLLVGCGAGVIIILEMEHETGKILKGRELSNLSWSGKRWTHAE